MKAIELYFMVLKPIQIVMVKILCHVSISHQWIWPGENVTLLHGAARFGDLYALKKLIDNGADVNQPFQNPKFSTALHLACYFGHAQTVELLLKSGSIIDEAGGEENCTGLHFAAENGHSEVVKILLKYNANANFKDKYGWVPIQKAILSKDQETITELLSVSYDNLGKGQLSYFFNQILTEDMNHKGFQYLIAFQRKFQIPKLEIAIQSFISTASPKVINQIFENFAIVDREIKEVDEKTFQFIKIFRNTILRHADILFTINEYIHKDRPLYTPSYVRFNALYNDVKNQIKNEIKYEMSCSELRSMSLY